jgi:hypothetical protein
MHVAHMPKATISTAVSSSNLNENHPLERAMNLIFMLVRGTGDSLICSQTTAPVLDSRPFYQSLRHIARHQMLRADVRRGSKPTEQARGRLPLSS